MKIKLIRRVPTTKAEYFDSIGISRRSFVLTRRSFPTIFRQLPTNESISKAAPPGFDPTTFRITIFYSTTAPHSLYGNLCAAPYFPCSVHVYLRQYCVYLRQYCVYLRQYCVYLRQYCVNLRQHCVFLPVLRSPTSILCFSSSVLC
jgi:hypothetical protein